MQSTRDDEVVLGVWDQCCIFVDLTTHAEDLDIEADWLATPVLAADEIRIAWFPCIVTFSRSVSLGMACTNQIGEWLHVIVCGAGLVEQLVGSPRIPRRAIDMEGVATEQQTIYLDAQLRRETQKRVSVL